MRTPDRGYTMSIILLMAESGSDITPELAGQLGVFIVPMHVTFGGETRDDGAFPVTQMFEHYKATLVRNRVKYRILEETPQSDGSIIVKVIKQYNQSPVGDYLN